MRNHVPEKGIAEHHIVEIVQRGIINHVTVNEEKHWQIDLLARPDSLFFETEAFHFGEIRSDLAN